MQSKNSCKTKLLSESSYSLNQISHKQNLLERPKWKIPDVYHSVDDTHIHKEKYANISKSGNSIKILYFLCSQSSLSLHDYPARLIFNRTSEGIFLTVWKKKRVYETEFICLKTRWFLYLFCRESIPLRSNCTLWSSKSIQMHFF